MPGISRIGPNRRFYYQADGVAPPHIHVERDAAIAKYWLAPVGRSRGFAAAELRSLERIVRERETQILEAWHEYFDA